MNKKIASNSRLRNKQLARGSLRGFIFSRQHDLDIRSNEIAKTLGISNQFYSNVLSGRAAVPINWCETLSEIFRVGIDRIEKMWLEDFKARMPKKEKVPAAVRLRRRRHCDLLQRLDKHHAL